MIKNIVSFGQKLRYFKTLESLIQTNKISDFFMKNKGTFCKGMYLYNFSTNEVLILKVQKNCMERSTTEFYRDTWIEINLSNIAHNLQQIRKKLPIQKKIYAVVKANAYGHGDIQVSKTALSSGAEGLAVAILDEAIKLRHAGIKAPILVLGWIRPKDAPLAAHLDISVPVFQKQWMQQAKTYDFKSKLKVHLKIDSGMGRIGVRTKQQLNSMLDELKDSRFELEGVFTHFSTADQQKQEYYQKQNKIFKEFVQQIHNKWSNNLIIHSGNSAASIRFPHDMYNAVRFGISLYGLYPSKFIKKQQLINLKQAMTLYSRLTHVKLLTQGQSVSYGRTYKTSGNEWIGSIGLGYADGYHRKLRGQQVIIEGKRMPLVGTICMDQMMIKLDKEYPVGTKVILIGEQRKQKIEIDEIADKLQTINYQVTCMMGTRIPRVYIQINNQ